jgi:hypothetical protein
MIVGFGLVSWSVRYGITGVKTFAASKGGIVHKAYLGVG